MNGSARRRRELPLGARPARRRSSGSRVPRAAASASACLGRPSSSMPKAIAMSSGSTTSSIWRLRAARPRAPARSPEARACRRSPDGRTRPRRGARQSAPLASRPRATSRPPLANRSAIRWQQRARRSASWLEEARGSPRCARGAARRSAASRASAITPGAFVESRRERARTGGGRPPALGARPVAIWWPARGPARAPGRLRTRPRSRSRRSGPAQDRRLTRSGRAANAAPPAVP